jgi:hypothetical protein
MRETERLIDEFDKKGNPLGKNITEEEIPGLANNLLERLNVTKEQLDFSPASLNRLAQLLLSYYQVETSHGVAFTDEDVVGIVREIAAYFGKTILTNTKGKLRSVKSIWGTEIEFEGPTRARKGNEVRTYSSSIISLGQIAAGTWSAVIVGVEPKLYKTYQFAIAKNVKEIH